jgi:hypothetical protein
LFIQPAYSSGAQHRRLVGTSPCAFALRIGLHVADVAPYDNGLWGAGVNLANRLSTLAQPGTTVASAALRNELGDGVLADIHDLGERIVKHLAEPVRAFRLSPPGTMPMPKLPSNEDLRPAVRVSQGASAQPSSDVEQAFSRAPAHQVTPATGATRGCRDNPRPWARCTSSATARPASARPTTTA